MFGVRHKVRTLVSGILTRHRIVRRTSGGAVDWLPPVLGPGDWSAGLLADGGARWYFDRNQA